MEDLEKWIVESKAAFTPEEYANITRDFGKMDLNSFVQKYDSLFKEKTMDWYDQKARKTTKSLAERLNTAFDGDFNPPKKWKEYIFKKEFPDVDKDYLEKYLKQMNEYKLEEQRLREAEAGKVKREKEVKNWPLYRNILASDYEKQRYINDPNKAIFGEDAPSIGNAPETRWGAMGDLAVGGVGAVADVVPTPLYTQTWVGPTLRGARDVAHSVFGDDGKDAFDIGKDFVTDFAFNAGTDLLPNWKRQGRMFKGFQKESGNVGKMMNLEDKVSTMTQQVSDLKPLLEKGDAVTIYDYIQHMPDSELKKDLLKKLPENIHQLDRKALMDDVNYWDILTRNVDDAQRQNLRTWLNNSLYGDLETTHGKSVMSEPFLREAAIVPTLTKRENLMKNALRKGEKVLSDKVSTPIIKSGRNAISEKAPKRDKETENEKIKDAYKNNESLTKQWLMGFVPREEKGDLMWEAYKEWKEENK